MKKYFEIFLVVFILFYIIYFILYKTYFGYLCGGYGYNEELKQQSYLLKISGCENSRVCSPQNIEVNNTNEITGWQCNIKKNNAFEAGYYINMGQDYIEGLFGNGKN